MQKIRNSSRDPEPEIEFIPEPPTEDMPSRYFEPAILAKLQNDGGNQVCIAKLWRHFYRRWRHFTHVVFIYGKKYFNWMGFFW